MNLSEASKRIERLEEEMRYCLDHIRDLKLEVSAWIFKMNSQIETLRTVTAKLEERLQHVQDSSSTVSRLR